MSDETPNNPSSPVGSDTVAKPTAPVNQSTTKSNEASRHIAKPASPQNQKMCFSQIWDIEMPTPPSNANNTKSSEE